jgi:hypothetical protein
MFSHLKIYCVSLANIAVTSDGCLVLNFQEAALCPAPGINSYITRWFELAWLLFHIWETLLLYQGPNRPLITVRYVHIPVENNYTSGPGWVSRERLGGRRKSPRLRVANFRLSRGQSPAVFIQNKECKRISWTRTFFTYKNPQLVNS